MGDAESLRGNWVIPARHLNAGQTAEALLRVGAAAGYSAVATGPNSFRLARTYRPRWATVCAIVGSVLLFGLFFLLVKRTEMADASVAEERDGVKLRLNGTVTAQCLASLQNCLEQGEAGQGMGRQRQDVALATSPVSSPVSPASIGSGFALQMVSLPTTWVPEAAAAAGAPPMVDSDRTVSSAQLRAMRQQSQSQQASCTLRFATGEVVAADRGAVIGRDPAPDVELPGAARIAIADSSLSKSHLTVGPSAQGVWVTDRHSTNGAAVLVHGTSTTCPPGTKVEVPVGATVMFGDRSFVVEAVS